MIELTEEPYDGPVGHALVHALLQDLNHRYAEIDLQDRPAHQVEDDTDATYLAEVTAVDVTRPAGAFLVAWLDGEAVGCGALRPSGPDGLGEVKRMYTAPVARGRGVGRAVLARLEAIAAELGYRRLRLETGTAQPEAIELYASAGWHRITPYGRYADHEASVCFGKDLPAR